MPASPVHDFLEAVITPAPLSNRAVAPGLIGWSYVTNYSGYTPEYCAATATWSQVGAYGRCCATTAVGCEIPTGCVRGSVVVATATSVTCGSTFPVCIVDYVFDHFGDSQTITWVGCDTARVAASFFRTSPASTVATTTTTSPPFTPISTSPGPSTSPIPPPPAHKSKAWIAGAAIGAVFVIALIAALVFWIFRLKKRPTASNPNDLLPSPNPPSGSAATYQPAYQPAYPQHQSYVPPPHVANTQQPEKAYPYQHQQPESVLSAGAMSPQMGSPTSQSLPPGYATGGGKDGANARYDAAPEVSPPTSHAGYVPYPGGQIAEMEVRRG